MIIMIFYLIFGYFVFRYTFWPITKFVIQLFYVDEQDLVHERYAEIQSKFTELDKKAFQRLNADRDTFGMHQM